MSTSIRFTVTIGTIALLVGCQSAHGMLAPNSAGTSVLNQAAMAGNSSKIVVAVHRRDAVLTFPANGNGNIHPMSVLSGPQTELDLPGGVFVDSNGYLYVTTEYQCTTCSTPAVNIYAPGASGNQAPVRQIVGDKTGLAEPSGLALDSQGNIYVANDGWITVYAPSANGNAVPVRTIVGANTELDFPQGLAINSNGVVAVANAGSNALTLYAAGADGNAAPIAIIQGEATRLDGPWSVAFDEKGNIYATSFLNGRRDKGWNVVEFSANANGNQRPTRTIQGPTTLIRNPGGLAVDAKGRIYVSNDSKNAASVTVYAPHARGNIAPITDISGSETHLLPFGGKLALSP